jgi:hypothetical protein
LQRSKAIDIKAFDHRSLRDIGSRNNQLFEPVRTGLKSDGQHPTDGLHPAIKGQFPHQQAEGFREAEFCPEAAD